MVWPFSRKAVSGHLSLKQASFLYSIGAARWLERDFQKLASEGYESNPIVFACVSKLAQSAASVDLQVYRQKKGGKRQLLQDHPLNKLLYRPNPMMGGKRFIETMATQKLVGGNAYIYGIGIDPTRRSKQEPKELWLMQPQKMQVVGQKRSPLPARYEYAKGQEDAQTFEVEQILGQSAILHTKTVNVLNPLVGLPPLVAARYGVDIFNSGQSWNKALLDNESRPSGALVVKGQDGKAATLSDTQYARMKEQVEEQFTGSKNAGRPLIMEGGMEWQQMSLSPKDMDHRENMLTNARFIAGVYHTPPQLVNIPGESTYSNYGQAELSYWANTVLPFLGSFLEDFNNWIAQFYGDDVYVWFDEDTIPALEPRRKEKADRIATAQYMTLNEKRRAMGMDDVKNGDVILVGYNTIPLEMIGDSVMLQNSLSEPGSPADKNPDDPEEDPEDDGDEV